MEQSWDDALHYYRIAAELGLADAQWRLARCLTTHEDPECPSDDSERWLEEAAKSGFARAQSLLGKRLLCEAEEEEQSDSKKSLADTASLVSDGDHERAEHQQAEESVVKTSESVDLEKEAVEWLRRASEEEEPSSLFLLGVCSWLGLGLEKDERAAQEYWEKAAEHGSVPALFALAEHSQSDLEGSDRSAEGRRSRSLSLSAFEDEDEEVEYPHSLEEATDLALRDNVDGDQLLAVGEAFEKGWGVEKDAAMAERFYRVAEERGCEEAGQRLAHISPSTSPPLSERKATD